LPEDLTVSTRYRYVLVEPSLLVAANGRLDTCIAKAEDDSRRVGRDQLVLVLQQFKSLFLWYKEIDWEAFW
jgi:hypothetical protein